VLGAKLYGVDATEGAALGAALLAGVGARLWNTADEACAEVVRKTVQTAPTSAAKESYDEVYELYRAMYPMLKGVSHSLSRWEEEHYRQ
jgi:xylulokinase